MVYKYIYCKNAKQKFFKYENFLFFQEKRGLVMSIFNWGIYAGIGLAFPIGRYITELNLWGKVIISNKIMQNKKIYFYLIISITYVPFIT